MTSITQLELPLPPGITFHRRSITILPGRTREQFVDLWRYLAQARGALAFWTADALVATRKQMGDEVTKKILDDVQIEHAELFAFDALNTLEMRSEKLSAEHHFVLAKLKDEVDQKRWMENAEREGLSPRELQLSIRAGTIVRATPAQTSTAAGIATVEAVMQLWDLLRAQIAEKWKDWTPEDARIFTIELLRMVEFYDTVCAHFAEKKNPGIANEKK